MRRPSTLRRRRARRRRTKRALHYLYIICCLPVFLHVLHVACMAPQRAPPTRTCAGLQRRGGEGQEDGGRGARGGAGPGLRTRRDQRHQGGRVARGAWSFFVCLLVLVLPVLWCVHECARDKINATNEAVSRAVRGCWGWYGRCCVPVMRVRWWSATITPRHRMAIRRLGQA